MKKPSIAKRIYSGSRRRVRSNRRTKRSRSAPSADTKWQRHGTALPSWKDLSKNKRSTRDQQADGFLERISTVRFALVILALAGAFTLYVGHVHATQDLLARLQEARRTNQSLHLKHNRLEGAYDRATGPSIIHRRAQALGLEENLAYGPPIDIE